MDYQFIRTEDGPPRAEFGMGNEAFSRWFSDELSIDVSAITLLLDKIASLQARQIEQYQHIGREFILTLDSDEVELIAKGLQLDVSEPLPEGMELYDQEHRAGCGLADFEPVLQDWLLFVESAAG